VVHGKDVDEVLANRVVDALGKAMKACTTHSVVLNGVYLGMTSDPRQACIHGAKEGLAEAFRSRLVPRVGLVGMTGDVGERSP